MKKKAMELILHEVVIVTLQWHLH